MQQKQKQKQLLLDLRSQLVGKMHTQPFTIYTDSTVEALLEAQPKSLEKLAKVKGFPKDGKRIKGFGEAVVQIFVDCASIESIEVGANDAGLTVETTLRPMSAF